MSTAKSRALELLHAGRLPEARALLEQVCQADRGDAEAWQLLGAVRGMLGDYAEAESSLRQALRLHASPGSHYYLGNALMAQNRLEEAIAAFQAALRLQPQMAEAHANLGDALQNQGRYVEAEACYRRAIGLRPDLVGTQINLGLVLLRQKRPQEAAAGYERILRTHPGRPEVHYHRGNAYAELLRLDEAIASYREAIRLKPEFAEAHNNLGLALNQQGRREEAIACYLAALRSMPDAAGIHANLGAAFTALGRTEEALACFDRAVALAPDHDFLLGDRLHARMHLCDWNGIEDDFRKLLDGVIEGKPVSTPFPLLAIPSSAAQQLRCATIYAGRQVPRSAIQLCGAERYAHDRIRLGYFSADFRNHATAYLMAELFERHDRARFEVIGYSYGPATGDAMRRRLEQAFDRLLDVGTRSDREIATLARQQEIDIAIDLKGHTTDSRVGIFSYRPAPLQVSFLGYPGTLGVDFMDYLIADPVVIPEDHRRHYCEQVACLPHSYQVNDSKRRISDRPFTRGELGLPGSGFVFCCFNNSYKITPDLFDLWMRLLRNVEGSVLWLREGAAGATRNLRKETGKRGVAPERIVFAGRMDLPEHLARHRLADLFLDTFYCNAHTTASDALWAGLPVLTCRGETFAGRVAASLLSAIGLPELITTTHRDYEALALELATQPGKLAELKQKLAANRNTRPLFDTGLFTRHLEEAYIRMWQRQQDGLAPEQIHVQA